MKYKVKLIAAKDKVELPDGAIVIETKSSITLVSPGDNYRVWTIYYLEPIGRK